MEHVHEYIKMKSVFLGDKDSSKYEDLAIQGLT